MIFRKESEREKSETYTCIFIAQSAPFLKELEKATFIIEFNWHMHV